MPYRHVLTVYDGSDESREVLDMVCRIARPHKARLTILIIKVIPLREELPVYKAGSDPEVDTMVQEAEKFADARGVKAATAVRFARAIAPSVVSESRLHGVDLVALAIPDLDQLPSEDAWHNEVRTVLRQIACAVMLCRPARTPVVS